MPLKLLVGKSTYGTSTTGYVSPRVAITLFEAVLSGRATEFWALAGVSSANFLGAIYDDEDNGNLIWECTTDTATTADTWAKQDIDETVDIEDGTTYGLAAMGDSTNVIKQESGQTGTLSRLQVGGLGAYGDGFPDPGTYSQQIKYTDRNYVYQVWGWEPPTITNFNGGSSVKEDDSVSIVGTDFMTAVGTGKVELCNNSVYASATVKVEQTDTAWGDTGITATIVQGTLSTGTVYAFVTTDIGQVNATGYSVTLTGGSSTNNAAISGSSPSSISSVSSGQYSVVSINASSPVSVAAMESTQISRASISGHSPSGTAIISAEQYNKPLLQGTSPSSIGDFHSIQTADGLISGFSPSSVGDIVSAQVVDTSLTAQSPADEADIIATQSVASYIGAESPAPESEIIASNSSTNNTKLQGLSPAGTASIDSTISGNYSVIIAYSPPSNGAMISTQNNAAIVEPRSPASTLDAYSTQSNATYTAAESPASVATIVSVQDVVNVSSIDIFSPASNGSILSTNGAEYDPIGYITLNNIIEAITLNNDISPITLNNTGDV